MGDALARRQMSRQILLDEIDERHHDFGCQQRQDQHRPHSMRLKPAKNEEQHRIDGVAHAMQHQLAALRAPPGQPLDELMVKENVERPECELNSDQAPQHQRVHATTSRNIPIWRIRWPSRGWMTCSVKLKRPSGSSAWVTTVLPGASQAGSHQRAPNSSMK